MAWVAVDHGIKAVDKYGLDGPVKKWRRLRRTIHDRMCENGYNPDVGAFVQAYGSDQVDASVLMMPLVGFLPPDDPRVRGTVAAIEDRLMHDGFVFRYDSAKVQDNLPPGEGAFLPFTFWYADNLALQGRHDKAAGVFERLLKLRNDLGLLSEKYDPNLGRLVGNFPQAFTHVALVNTALNLARPGHGPADLRREE